MSTNKRKILSIITKSNWGGAQKYVFDLATKLPSDEFETSVLLGGEGELKKRLLENGIKTTSISELGRDVNIFADCIVFLKLVFYMCKERPDIVHLNSSKIGILGAIAGKIARVPKIIFTGHGWAFNENRGSLQKKIFLFFHWATVFLCNSTIVVSEKMKKEIEHLPFIGKKITVIHNGVEAIDFLTQEESRKFILEKVGKTTEDVAGKQWIGTIAELHKNKGQKYLIRGLARLKKDYSHLAFAYFFLGEGELREELIKLTKNLGLEQEVFFVGHVENAPRYLKAFNIFTLTSTTEALSYSLLEAGLAGRAVIASDVGGIPEIISDNTLGILVRSRNDRDIELGLKTLLEKPDSQKKYGDMLATHIQDKFSFEKMLSKHKNLYNQK